jgi:hypothetical protein
VVLLQPIAPMAHYGPPLLGRSSRAALHSNKQHQKQAVSSGSAPGMSQE